MGQWYVADWRGVSLSLGLTGFFAGFFDIFCGLGLASDLFWCEA
jgi:hypothetical protein